MDLLLVAIHETYPGHQAERSVKEHQLVRGQGLLEETIVLVPTTVARCGRHRPALLRWGGLMTPELATHLVRFMTEPTSRTYVMNYPAWRELCAAYVAGQPELFGRLLSEQIRVRDLIGANRH